MVSIVSNSRLIEKVELVDIDMTHEDGRFTFALRYHVHYKDGKIEVIELPSVSNPFRINDICVDSEVFSPNIKGIAFLDTYNTCRLNYVKDPASNAEYYMKRKIIKEADPVEMTIDEIEAALGKRIKIVGKGDKK